MSERTCGSAFTRNLVGDPIDVVTGANQDRALDCTLDGPIPVRFFRYYDSRWARAQRGLGYGHRHGFEHWLVFDLDGVTYRAPDGKDRHFRHFTDDGERQASGGVWLERVSEERYELTGYGLPKLVFRRSARARDAELVEWIEEVDGREERLRFVYEAGRLDKILAPRNETLKLAWSADGLLAGVEHWSSDGHGKKWLIRYEYEHGYLTAGTDAYKQTFRLAYDENGLVCRRTDRRGYSFYFEYDSKGRCVASRGVDGLLSVQLTYKPLEYETRVVDANGAEWIYQYTPEGVVTLITDPYGGVEYFKLGDDGRLLERYDPNGAKTSYVYDAAGAAIARIDPDGRRVTLPEPEVEPPRYGERVPTRAIQLEQGDAWDPSFRLPDPYELPFDLPAEVHAALTTSTHIARGAVETELDPYGLRLRVALEDGRARTYGYDENGGLRRVTDLDGGTWRLENESWNQLVGELDPNGHRTSYEWSSTEALAAVTDAAGTRTEYVRDLKDRVVELWRHERMRERYAYDPAGHLVEKRDANDEVLFTVERDPAGRALHKRLTSGEDIRYRYDAEGRLVEARTAHHTATFAYDLAGRCVADERDGLGVRHRYAGPTLLETVVLGRFRTEYHALSGGTRVVVDPTGATHRIRSHGRGLFTRDLANGLSETTQYEPRAGRVLAKVLFARDAPGHAWARRFEYSGEGDLLRVLDSERGLTRYGYDPAHRLTEAHHPDGRHDTYAYNAAGTLARSPTLTEATVGKGNQLRSANGERLEHDHRDHLAKRTVGTRGTLHYDYDSLDQLAVVYWQGADGKTWGWDAAYDALGRRIQKAPGYTRETRFYWDGDRLAAELFHDGRVRVYVYPDAFALVPMLFIDYTSVDADPASGTRYYVLTDQRGAVERVLGDDGATVWKATLDPYGHARVEVGQGFHQPLRLPGQYHDVETGLSYNRFRYYDPVLGRYLQSDPWGLAGGLNVYAYAKSPLVQWDARGLCPNGGDARRSENHPNQRPDSEGQAHPRQHPAEDPPHLAQLAEQDALRHIASDPDLGNSEPVRNLNGGVDFANTPFLYPAGPGERNIVKIEYTGSRGRDEAAANQAAGFTTTPEDYTWHHLDNYDPRTNTGTMQLVERDAHRASLPHNGGVRQYEQAHGVEYR